ncbi:MAG: zinc ribbon domain-containing protein [Desulfobulbaceae bacterium]|nr:zinc ribbon domain-containing protein [Desulfobulbaceae bacterium]
MPIYEYRCEKCGSEKELFVNFSDPKPICPECGAEELKKLLSPTSSLSSSVSKLPGPGDTACCGASPERAHNCAGPGSCCGKNMQ